MTTVKHFYQRNIIEYHTIVSDNRFDLDGQVNHLLNQGYELYKGPYGSGPSLCQALIKCEYVPATITTDEVDTDEDPCPECGSKLLSKPRGGVECTKCDYWFCY